MTPRTPSTPTRKTKKYWVFESATGLYHVMRGHHGAVICHSARMARRICKLLNAAETCK